MPLRPLAIIVQKAYISGMSEMSRDEFVDKVIEIVKQRFPLAKIERIEGSFALRVNGRIAGLENVFRGATLKPDSMVHQIERWAVELIRVSEGTPDEEADFDKLKERILPAVVNEAFAEAASSQLVQEPFVADLKIVYALDSDRTISYLQRQTINQWNLSDEELHDLAIDNLVKRSEAIAAHAAQNEDGQIDLILFQTLDGYDAARLLLPTLHDRLKEHLGSPFCAGVPNRDILLCFRNDEKTVNRLRDQIAKDYQQMPHQVTDKLLLVTADGIAARDAEEKP
jgi:uncharacterized protein YtpQ (UPF0354 family)